MKIRQLGAEVFHVDRQTNRQTDRHIVRRSFQNFVNEPVNERMGVYSSMNCVDGVNNCVIREDECEELNKITEWLCTVQ
jgi:hypothetical protein